MLVAVLACRSRRRFVVVALPNVALNKEFSACGTVGASLLDGGIARFLGAGDGFRLGYRKRSVSMFRFGLLVAKNTAYFRIELVDGLLPGDHPESCLNGVGCDVTDRHGRCDNEEHGKVVDRALHVADIGGCAAL